MELTVGLGGILMHVCAGGRERGRKSKGAVLTGFLQITGSLTAVESNGAGRAESITGHNRFSHRSELGKAVLYGSADSWNRASTGKGAGSRKKKKKKRRKKAAFLFDKLVTHYKLTLFLFVSLFCEKIEVAILAANQILFQSYKCEKFTRASPLKKKTKKNNNLGHSVWGDSLAT